MVNKGFSLVEALVVMAVISVLFAVSTKVITTKPKPAMEESVHGYYECVSGSFEKYNRDGVETPLQRVSECKFEPPIGASFFNVSAADATRNFCYTGYEPNINNKLSFRIKYKNVTIISENPYMEQELPLDHDTCTDVKNFFKTSYPDVEMFNSAVEKMNPGVFISW